MPLARISLLKGRSADQLRAIADGVHAALVATYAVPPGDRFQIIDQLEPGEIIYSPDYMGVERTDDIVIIQITAGRWRDDDAKRALYRAIAENLSRDAGLRPQNVQVILTGNERADWSFGDGVATYLQDRDGS